MLPNDNIAIVPPRTLFSGEPLGKFLYGHEHKGHDDPNDAAR